jgi:cyclophilin family peptidyl-prolyl cis-trans isomerase
MARPFRLLTLSLAALWPTTLAAAPADLPEGYTPTPPLAEEPVREFEGADEVLMPNTDYGAVMVTNKGTMILDLYEDLAPRTVNNFVFLARHRFYDGVVFHRVLEGFMAQTGDPTGTGTGGPGYQFDDEFAEGLQHDRPGLLSMANAGPNTNGSQFFITFTETPWLDGAHAIFGEVTEGLEVLDALQRIDPSQPSAIVAPADSLADLSQQGVTLAGEADSSVEAYLTAQLGGVPARGERFEVDGFSGVVGQGGGGETLVGFFPEPDVIESLTIIERPRD